MSAAARSGRVGHVAWQASGEGPGLPVLALHGFADSGECWAPLVRHLAAGRTVVAPDARGHGSSGLPEEPFSIEALAADAAAVVRTVVGRPVVVVGHSMGGATAEELALREPDLVAALILEDPAWSRDEEDARGVPVGMADWVHTFAGRTEAQLLALSRAQDPHWPDDEHGPWARSKVAFTQRVVDLPHRWNDRDWPAALADVRVPVTLVTGDPQRGSVVTPEAIEVARRVLGPRMVHVPLPTGHNVRREARDEFFAAVDAALARADAAAGTAGR